MCQKMQRVLETAMPELKKNASLTFILKFRVAVTIFCKYICFPAILSDWPAALIQLVQNSRCRHHLLNIDFKVYFIF